MRDTRRWGEFALIRLFRYFLNLMKLIVTTVLAFSALLGCTSPSPPNRSDSTAKQQGSTHSVEEIALRQIFNKISHLPNTTFTDKQILINTSSITLKEGIEFNGQEEGNWIYAAKFTTSYNSEKETDISIGSIGIGASASEAQDVCIQEWLATFGIAFTSMLQDSNAVAVSNMKIFPGLMGIRGSLPENTWLKGDDNMTKIIMSKIGSRVALETGTLIPIDIKIMVKANKAIDGECRINNQISIGLMNDLKQLDWPSSKEGFLFKQFYLIKKTKAKASL